MKNLLQHSQPLNSVDTDWRVAKFHVLQISGRVALKMCRNRYFFLCFFSGKNYQAHWSPISQENSFSWTWHDVFGLSFSSPKLAQLREMSGWLWLVVNRCPFFRQSFSDVDVVQSHLKKTHLKFLSEYENYIIFSIRLFSAVFSFFLHHTSRPSMCTPPESRQEIGIC